MDFSSLLYQLSNLVWITWLELLRENYFTQITSLQFTTLLSLPHLSHFIWTDLLQLRYLSKLTWSTSLEEPLVKYFNWTTSLALFHLKCFKCTTSLEIFNLNSATSPDLISLEIFQLNYSNWTVLLKLSWTTSFEQRGRLHKTLLQWKQACKTGLMQ